MCVFGWILSFFTSTTTTTTTTNNNQPPTTNHQWALETLDHLPETPSFRQRYGTTALSSAMGVHLVGSVGGGDMPCCITVLHLGPHGPTLGWPRGGHPLTGRNMSSLKLTFSHLKLDGWNTSFLLGWPIFRCYVSFREGNHGGGWLLRSFSFLNWVRLVGEVNVNLPGCNERECWVSDIGCKL